MVTNPSVQMEKDEIKQDNLNAKDVNESVEDNDVENFNQFDQEEHLASSIERFTNDVHLEKNPVEIMSFENQEDGNVYPNEILITNLSTVGIHLYFGIYCQKVKGKVPQTWEKIIIFDKG